MPQLAPVILNDGTANRTYAPQDIKANIATSALRPNAAVGDAQVLTRSLTGNDKTGFKPMLKLTIPVVASVAGVPTVVDNHILMISGRLSARDTEANRTIALNLLKALAAHADTTAMVVGLQGVY